MEYRQDDKELCLECGESFYLRRNTMKFCCNECRQKYHNRVNNSLRRIRLRNVRDIEESYLALSGLLDRGIREASLSEVCLLGFRPGSATSASRVGRHIEFRLHDIRFRQSDTRVYCIERMSGLLADTKSGGKTRRG